MSNIVKAASAAALLISAVGAFWMTDPGFAYSNAFDVTPALQANQNNNQNSSTVAVPVAGEAQDSANNDAIAQVDKPVETPKAQPVIITDEKGNSSDLDEIQKKADALRAERPQSASSLNELVRNMPTDIALTAEQTCLAGAVYFESKSESLAGQLAVARVVINRAKSGRFPKSICGVVYQPSQFSFVRGRSMPRINKAGQQWKNAIAITQIAMDNSWKSSVEGALFFHARHVSPGWKLRRMAQVDNHIFYR